MVSVINQQTIAYATVSNSTTPEWMSGNYPITGLSAAVDRKNSLVLLSLDVGSCSKTISQTVRFTFQSIDNLRLIYSRY